LRYAYKSYPEQKGGTGWWAVVSVQIANPARHSPPTKRFEALLDSGASRCIFHSSLGRAIGLSIEEGEIEETIGVSGKPSITYLHNISLYVAGGIIGIRAGFANDLPIAGMLGRKGFFEHFKVTFDPSSDPPGFEIERIYKA
jgi:hypothetical protein